jgi:hypothetical protein
MRKTLFLIASEAINQSNISVTATIIDAKKRDLGFTALVSYQTSTSAPNGVVATVCDPNGKIKSYRDLDAILRDVVGTIPSTNTVNISTDVVPLQKPLSLNTTPTALLTREKASLQRSIARQDDFIDKATVTIASIASYATGSVAQQAFYTEQVDRKTIAEASKAAMVARLAVVDGLL